MSAPKRERVTGRKENGHFLYLSHALLNHENYIELPVYSKQLLTDIATGYTGHNNGDLCCTLKVMRKRGWTSNDMLTKYLKPLLEKGFLVRTKVGGLRMGPHLYALTWRKIDVCKGKLDMQPTKQPLNWWKTGVPERKQIDRTV